MATSGNNAVKVVCTVMLMCMLISAPYMADATITCGQVVSTLSPCVNYLTQKGALVPGCCGGVKSLNNAAKTTPDRKAACGCLKGAINSFKGINLSLVAGLPRKCGVSIPYKIAPSTDCSKVV